jgi:eukaryotic-like serine/threonine-protein kinase
MPLVPGSHLGPYEIIGRIGAGGMGEVFSARDTRLERSVAIKILPAQLAQNAQFRLRFEREAKTISQLNHPHICTLCDVGEGSAVEGEATFSYLVMELIEGESLADRLMRGPVALDDVLRYGIEIAEALDKAHRQGVIHRDLKPGNIMLTKSGAKLLDFGLAKSMTVEVGADELTRQKALTAEGTIVGTFQYMAPEQLEGQEAGARTDIFALGCVLYEMATGHRAFDGKTKTSLIAAIVGGHPRPISEFQPLIPPALTHVVSRCLEKDPDDRWQSAHDVAEELKWINTAGSQAGVPAPLMMRRRSRERMAWTLLPIVALLAVAASWALLKYLEPRPHAVESSVTAPRNFRISANDGGAVISPDGSSLVMPLTDQKSNRSLWIRQLSGGAMRVLSGTEDGSYPFWSPNSRRIGFFASGKLKIVDAAGGVVQTIADAPNGRGGSWSQEGTIVFAPGIATGLMKISDGGGAATPATTLDKATTTHRFPSFLPDGRHFLLYTDAPSIAIGSLDSPGRVTLLRKENAAAVYVASGHVLFWRDGFIVAQPFDVKHLVPRGDAVPIAEGVAASRGRGVFSASDDGTLVYQPGSASLNTQLIWVDRSGKDSGVVAPKAEFYSPKISHDQRKVAVDRTENGAGDIWLFDLVRNVSSRLTYDPANESSPVWSIDDKQLFFFRDEKGTANIYQISAGGTGNSELVIASDNRKFPTDASRDWLVLATFGANSDIWTYSFADKKIKPWLATPFQEGCGELSPDGKWIAYQSDESGRLEIYVRAFPDSQEKWLISTDGGETPAWRGDGREIYYISRERKMMAAPISYEPKFDAGTPVVLFDAPVRQAIPARQYDVSSDGKRFLLNREAEQEVIEPLTLVQNWIGRLARR